MATATARNRSSATGPGHGSNTNPARGPVAVPARGAAARPRHTAVALTAPADRVRAQANLAAHSGAVVVAVAAASSVAGPLDPAGRSVPAGRSDPVAPSDRAARSDRAGWGGPRGGRGGGGRRRRGEVRTALLLLIAEQPRNGYQLMQEIEQRSGGSWRPSPGSVYPALSQLEDEGLIRTVQGESGRAFEITDAGREQAESLSGQAPPWQEDEEQGGQSMHKLGRLIMSAGMAAWQVAKDGDEDQVTAACEVLAQTRRTLYGILAGEPQERADAPVDEAGEAGDEPGGEQTA